MMKKTNDFLTAVRNLKAGEEFKFTYSDRTKCNKPEVFKLTARKNSFFGKSWSDKNEKKLSYSVSSGMFESMNISSITRKYVNLYSFDMMTQQSKFKMDINLITLI